MKRFLLLSLPVLILGLGISFYYASDSLKAAVSRALIGNVNKTGLVAFWDFDDCDSCTSVTDRSGNNNKLTMYTTSGTTCLTATNLHTALGKIRNGSTYNGTINCSKDVSGFKLSS